MPRRRRGQWGWPLALALVSGSGGWLFGLADLWRLAALLGALLGLCWLYSWLCLRGLRCERRLPQAPTVSGGDLDEEIILINSAPWPVLWVQVGAVGDLPNYRPGRVVALGPRAQATWRQRTPCPHRGRYELGALIAQAGDPFGLFVVSRWCSGPVSVVVLPRPLRADMPSLLAPGPPTLQAAFPARGGERTALLRPAGAFDRPSHIAWAPSLRTGTLLARQEEGAAQAAVRLVVDLGGVLDEDEAERVAGVAVYLAHELLRGGHAVGLLCGGAEVVELPPASGPAHAARLWHALALAAAGAAVDLSALLARPARGLGVAVISASPAAQAQLYAGRGPRRVSGDRAAVLIVPPPVSPPTTGPARRATPARSGL